MNALTESFTQAVAEAKYLYATWIAPMPPKKVRAILENEGWKFSYEKPDPLPPQITAHLGTYFENNVQNRVIRHHTGRDIFKSGSAMIELYEKALERAARKAYGLKP